MGSLEPSPRLAPKRISRAPSPLMNGAHTAENVPSTSSGVTKAQLVAQYRSHRGEELVAEHLLVRDALYLLQGISGKYVKFSKARDGKKQDVIFQTGGAGLITESTRTLLHRISEVGHLFIEVRTFTENRVTQFEDGAEVGLVEQSICHYMQSHLTDYYQFVAALETQLHDESAGEVSKETSSRKLTLRRLDVWIDDWRLRMRMMSTCVENCRGEVGTIRGDESAVSGGALLSLLHANTRNGDPFILSFTKRLLVEVSKPFFSILQKWIFDGVLNDPHGEFFVEANSNLVDHNYANPAGLGGDADLGYTSAASSENSVGGLELWQSKFQFKKDMLPSFLSEEFGRKIFSTGKSLNFIRFSCNDSDWVATRSKLQTTDLTYADLSGLEQSIDKAFEVASQRLFEIFFEKFRLIEHLESLKGYLLLGRGDFAEHLLEDLGPSLSRPANTLHLHQLTSSLEGAIEYSTTRTNSATITKRLDARMLDYQRGEIGWDVFTLEYKVTAPIDTVLDPHSMLQYEKLFAYLWGLKRLEGVVSTSWLSQKGIHQRFDKLLPDVRHRRKRVAVVQSEMAHFVRQLLSYCQLNIIASRWASLMEFTAKKQGDLDALIGAHQKYLDEVVRKVLLLHAKKEKEEIVLVQVKRALSLILEYKEACDAFHNNCLARATTLDSLKDRDRGVHTNIGTSSTPVAGSNAAEVEHRLDEFEKAFTASVVAVVQRLTVHADPDCRSLAVHLSFNDFYKSQRDDPPTRSHTPAPS